MFTFGPKCLMNLSPLRLNLMISFRKKEKRLKIKIEESGIGGC